jgi:hypothetical protein
LGSTYFARCAHALLYAEAASWSGVLQAPRVPTDGSLTVTDAEAHLSAAEAHGFTADEAG